MRYEIAPSVLSCDPANYGEPAAEMMRAGADWIQFDVMDGQFVPPITFGANLVKSIQKIGSTKFEAHLMTLTPEKHFEAFAEAGCERVIFHVEAATHPHRLLGQLREMGLEAAAAINPGTPVESLLPLVEAMDMALIMTVNPGWGGQQLIESCLDKVRRLRELAPDLNIAVDGGVDPESLGRLKDAGANTFCVGSYLMRAPSIAEGMAMLRQRCA